MSDFDLNRISSKTIGKVFRTLYNPRHIPIQKALQKRLIEKDTELFIVKINAKNSIAFSKKSMAYYHFAEGYLDDQPYMLTFCIICNSGMVLNPEVGGKMFHFEVAGTYNGMVLMSDKETGSYWDHITGKCLHGRHEGYQLQVLQTHLVLTAEEYLTNYPQGVYGVPKLNLLQRFFVKFQNSKTSVTGDGFLPPTFRKSMLKNDERLPEMEMGLGIWEDSKTAKFYPIKFIKKNKEQLLIETFKEQNVLIYIAPLNGTPKAIYIPKNLTCRREENRLVLSNGYYILAGALFSADNQELNLNEPGQMFSRWYGFIATFPNCAVAGQD